MSAGGIKTTLLGVAMAGALLATTSVASAGTITISGPLTAAQLDALNGTGASYGPPPAARFLDGPITVPSGTASTLFAGNKKGASIADTALLVLSAPASAVATLGSITLTFASLPSITLSASDFFTTAAADFPTSIGGIANGAVNGIKFPTAVHAAVELTFTNLIHSLYGTDDPIGAVTIDSPINLRVDVFGDHDGLIVNNTPNSGAEGVTRHKVPEPATLGILGIGLLGIGLARRRKTA